MIEYVLAIVFFAAANKYAPFFVSPHATRAECMAKAAAANKEDPGEKLAKAGDGAEYACLKIERAN